MLQFNRKSTKGILLAAAVASLGHVALGATATWVGNTDGSWLTGSNWTGGGGTAGAAAATDLLFFGAAGTAGSSLSNNFAADTSFSGITFGPAAGAYTLGGNRILLTGDITDNSTAAQSI